MHTRWRARREPRVELTWETGDDAPCEWVIGDDRPGASEYEAAHSALAPPMVYPLFETALRAAPAARVDEHQRHVSELWARFAGGRGRQSRTRGRSTAYSRRGDPHRLARQPHGVLPVPEAHVRQHRRRPGARRCCCARTKRRTRPACPTTAWSSCTRRPRCTTTTSSASAGRSPSRPAIATAVGDALDAAGITLDDVARFDLYSCFPSAVQVATRALGIAADDPRPLTVTGGLGLRGRTGEQLSDPRDRAHGRLLRADPGELRLHDRARLVHLEARDRHLVGDAARERGFRRVDPPSARPRSTRGPAASPPGSLDGPVHARSDVGLVRARRHPVARHRHRAHRRRTAGARQRPRPRPARTPSRPKRTKAGPVRITNDGTTNTAHLE